MNKKMPTTVNFSAVSRTLPIHVVHGRGGPTEAQQNQWQAPPPAPVRRPTWLQNDLSAARRPVWPRTDGQHGAERGGGTGCQT